MDERYRSARINCTWVGGDLLRLQICHSTGTYFTVCHYCRVDAVPADGAQAIAQYFDQIDLC